MNFYRFGALGLMVVSTTFAGARQRGGSPELPFTFVTNAVQVSREVLFVGNGPGFRAQFRQDGFTVHQGSASARISFAGNAGKPVVGAMDPIGATLNYLRGGSAREWLHDLPLYRTLFYRGVWTGIDVRFRGERGSAKAEYLVAPGSGVEAIHLRFDGEAAIGADGSLTVCGASGQFHENRPYLYQERDGVRAEVAGAFRIYEDGTVGFVAAEWDHALPLVVDPTILFSGYFGGAAQTTITAMAVNSYYNTVVAGWTLSTDLTASAGAQRVSGGGVDAFVATFGPAGGNLISCTYLGGSGDDRVYGLTLDAANNIYVTGWTMSRNFPVVGAFQTKLSGIRDAFVAKLNPSASALIFSSYLGGTGVDWGAAIRVNSDSTVVLAGNTTSANLPATAGAFQRSLGGAQDAFLAKLNAAGSAVTMLTYLGGSANEFAAALALDATGGMVVAGSTSSSNMPVLNAFQARSGGGQDAFVARLSASGAALIYSTYFGGSGGSAGAPEQATCVSISAAGNVTVAGTTSSLNFPLVAGAAQTVFAGGLTDGFIANIGPTGLLRRSTYLGGSGDDGINAMVPDPYGAGPVVGGYTTSADFPVKNPVQAANAGGMDGFVVRSSYSAITHGTYIGGSGSDSVNAVAVDSLFNFTVAGTSGSPDVPRAGSMPGYQGSTLGSFVTKISGSFAMAAVVAPNFVLDIWRNTGYNGPATTLGAASYGLAGDIPVAGDWTGSGVKRLGVFRNGTWILDTNGNGVLEVSDRTVSFGLAGDTPLVGDWNGDGKVDLGLFRQGTFILDFSGHITSVPTGLLDQTFVFGLPGDAAVAGDWSNSGVTRVGVFRSGQWILDLTGAHTPSAPYSFGQAGDKPVVGNWAGFGDSIGIYRNGVWILDYDLSRTISAADMVLAFGGPGFTPLIWQ